MSNQTLRELAKDYARGETDKESYRKSRTELIKAIIEGTVAVKVIDYPPPLIPSEDEAAITEAPKRDKTEIVSPSSKKRPARREPPAHPHSLSQTKKESPLIFILVSAAIVVSLIIAVILFYPKPPGATTSVAARISNKTQAPALSANTIDMAGESLIADFLSQRNWTNDSLDTFLDSWSSLTQDARDSAKSGKRMQRMHDSLYKQFLEEKALSSIDSEKAALKQQKLIEFAAAIGIDDSRLVLE